MSRKRKPYTILTDVIITAMAAEGKAIGRICPPENDPTADARIIFVPYAVPGDICDLQITKKKRSYLEGRIITLKQPSPHRIEPICPHFGVCGGCRWQHVPYAMQLEHKQQQVRDAMERIGKVEIGEYLPIVGASEISRYRNKLEFTFSHKRWFLPEELLDKVEGAEESEADRAGLGFHIPGMFDKVLDIDHCYLGSELSDRIRLFVRDYCTKRIDRYPFYDLRAQGGFMRNLLIRTASTGETMVVFVFYEDREAERIELLEATQRQFPEITSLIYFINPKCNDTFAFLTPYTFAGCNYIIEEMEGLRFAVGPKSFYQTNSSQAYELYKVARKFAQLSGGELVYDLYTGTGTIANFVARQANRVIGIEYVEDAIVDARINSEMNGLTNCTFFAGDMKDILTPDFVDAHGRPDVIITDPPRAGMHDDVIATILSAAPRRIVYVSCNPATQARDLALLTTPGQYRVVRSCAVDMFPHTQHIENVVQLDRLD